MDLEAGEGLKRAGKRGQEETRFEEKGVSFHQRLREEFLAIAAREPNRVVVVDASLPIEVVAAAIWAIFDSRLLLDVA